MMYHTKKIIRAKELRKNAPRAEVNLWYAINNNQLGVKFRRQRPIGPYFVDFVCLEKKLVIELDGDQHGTDAAIKYDNQRTDFIKYQGYKIIRIPNDYIYKGLYDVVAHLRKIINDEIYANEVFVDKYE